MKKISIPAFGESAQVWYNIGRLAQVEGELKKPIGDLITELSTINLKTLFVLLKYGMRHEGLQPESYWASRIDKALEDGYTLADIHGPVSKAIIASGIFGEAAYYKAFPDEAPEEGAADTEKN